MISGLATNSLPHRRAAICVGALNSFHMQQRQLAQIKHAMQLNCMAPEPQSPANLLEGDYGDNILVEQYMVVQRYRCIVVQ